MPASMFQMGFRAGGFQPLPLQLGISIKDLQEDWKGFYEQVKGVKDVIKSPSTPKPITPLPPPAQPSTILGLPSSTVMIGGAALLGVGVLAAVLLSQN